MDKISILIVDDHKIVRQGLKMIFEFQQEFEVTIDEAENAAATRAKLQQAEYDLIFMDVDLGEDKGTDLTKYITKKYEGQKIIALSMHDEHFLVKKMLNSGVEGYLLKNTGQEELLKAVKTVLSGQKYYCNEIANILLNNKPDERISSKISKRELEILKLIALEYTNEQIATKLNLSKRTVDGHRQNMIGKLGVKNSIGLIKHALQNGLLD